MFLSLFVVAFVSATLWPMASEVVFVGLLSQNPDAVLLLLLVATAGNTLGAWAMVECARFFSDWSRQRIQQNRWNSELWLGRVRRFGPVFMVFAWLPLIGDLLPLAGGLLKIRRLPTVLFLAVGKGLRYCALVGAYFGLEYWI